MATILKGDGSFSFTVEVDETDLKVRNVVSTWFSGPNDRSDSGHTASGVDTRRHPDLLGCALPMDGFGNAHTDGSPLPRMPWNIPVKVTNLKTEKAITLPLVDLGPSKNAASRAAIDLTEAAFRALGGNPRDGIMRVNYTIVDGAKYVASDSPASVSIPQSLAHSFEFPQVESDAHGRSSDVRKPLIKAFIPSPNYSSRNGVAVHLIVLHYTAGPTAQGAINRF